MNVVATCRSILLLLGFALTAMPIRGVAQLAGATAVSIPTRQSAGAPPALRAMVWTPSQPPRGAVVVVHGSGGLQEHPTGFHARSLAAEGYVAIAVDSFGSRGVTDTIRDQTLVTTASMARDAFDARRFLIQQGITGDRIAVMGFSKGGTVALFAADANWLPEEADRFRAAVPFYPACVTFPRSPKPAAAVFMALGEKDNWAGVEPCQRLAGDFAKAGGSIKVKVYPDSAHAFDGFPNNTGMIHIAQAENYMNCVSYLEPDGKISYLDKSYDVGDIKVLEAMRSTCMRKGASVWTNPRQKEAARQDVVEFLNSVFPR